MANEMEELFGDVFGALFDKPPRAPNIKGIDLCENKDGYTLYMEVPGVELKNLQVTVEDNQLCVKGQFPPRKETFLWMGRVHSKFERAVRLTSNIDVKHIKAELSNGLLTVTIPRIYAEKAKILNIPVTEGK
jgi:HSP20 family protein